MQNNKSRHFTKKHHVSNAERRYRTAMFKIRGFNRNLISKETQTDIAYLINEVDRYGFTFFANHYVIDSVERLEGIANVLSLSKQQKDQK